MVTARFVRPGKNPPWINWTVNPAMSRLVGDAWIPTHSLTLVRATVVPEGQNPRTAFVSLASLVTPRQVVWESVRNARKAHETRGLVWRESVNLAMVSTTSLKKGKLSA